jgi:hypothetical protein
LAVLYPEVAFAQPRTVVELTLRNCSKIEASAILGANASGCLIYDLRKKQASTTIEVCGGLMLKLALKEVVIGGEFGHEKIGCVTIKTVLNPSDAQSARKLLTSPAGPGVEIRRRTLGEVKSILKRADDKDLKDLGITRDQIEGLDRLRFESPRDETDRRDQIRKSIDQCTPIGIRPLG